MPVLTFNQMTATMGGLYALSLFYYFRKLKDVWKREADRARLSLAVFAALFVLSTGGFSYIYYLRKKRAMLERKAVEIIQRAKDKPLQIVRSSYISRFVKIGSAVMLTFITLHRIMRKT